MPVYEVPVFFCSLPHPPQGGGGDEKPQAHPAGRGRPQDIELTLAAPAEHNLADRGMKKLETLEQFEPTEARGREPGFTHWLLESVADGVIACDADGRLILFNHNARQWFGGDFKGVSLDEWANHYQRYRENASTPLPATQAPLVRAFQGETFTSEGIAIVAPGKPARFIRVSGGPIRDAEGRKLGAVVVMCDVTKLHGGGERTTENDVEATSSIADLTWEIAERKQAEEKMLRSEQRLRLHSEQSPLGFLEWDDNFRAIEWNAACERIFGYTREEAIGRHAKDLILPIEVHQLVDGIYHSLMNQTGGQHSINENVTKDGRIIICEWFNTTLIDKDGKAIGVASICRDITEQKKAEDELSRYREHLEELVLERTAELEISKNKAQQYLDIAGVMLVAIDKNRRVTLINQKGCEVLGRSQGDILGKDWFETFVPENVCPDVIQSFRKLMAGELEPVEYFENPVLTQDGQERLIAWHNALLRDDEGNIVGTLSSGEDITEHKRAEKQIICLNQNLLNRTEGLEAANKELEAFAYSVSHDLRAPLRHIDGFIGLLQMHAGSTLDEQSRHYMASISDSANKMGQLIDDLLSFSRMGRQTMSFQPVDLGSLVRDVIRELEPDAAERNIQWRISNLPAVCGDAAMLRIVMANLISNAFKFTRSRQQARIEIGSLPGQDFETVIFVRDNGVGFDMTFGERLFGVFQRLHHADEFEGTGIGLASVRRIVARHGGRTWAQGESGQGAAFFFSLPQIPIGGGHAPY